jgi:hypothetical protein
MDTIAQLRNYDIRLVHPADGGFRPASSPVINNRARTWALAQRVALVDDGRLQPGHACAHLLHLADAGICSCSGFGLDHTHAWVPLDDPARPFLLTQPYGEDGRLAAYADAHGLIMEHLPWDCWWTGPGDRLTATPVRLAVPEEIQAPWALGRRTAVILAEMAGRRVRG